MWNGMMHGMGHGMSGGFFGFGLFGFLLMLALIAVVVWMMKPGTKGYQASLSSGHNSADILKDRLAKGEISEEEYDRLKRKLEQ